MRCFNIFVDENNFKVKILEILKEICPEWEENYIQFKIFSDGITNKLIGSFCHSISTMILFRINGNETDAIIDRDAEIVNMNYLNQFGFAPKIYAKFLNGICYEFIPGVIVTTSMIFETNVWKLIAIKMAQMHKICLTKEQKRVEPMIISKTLKYLQLIPDKFKDERVANLLPSKDNLINQFKYLESILISSSSPIVFCHNDLLLPNIIYTSDSDKVHFIDFEYSQPNYQAFDIANHFAKIAGAANDSGIDYNKYPSKDFQMRWLKHFLREFHSQNYIYNTEIEHLYKIVCKFVAAAHFLWTCWCLIQAEHSSIDFDFVKLAIIYYDEYLRRKKQYLD